MTDSECIFCKIVSGDIPVNKIYEDDGVLGFEDIFPQAKIHDLFIPKRHISSMKDLLESDGQLLSKIHQAANQQAEKRGIADSGYRLVTNCGGDAGQTVFHLHYHLLGGESLSHFGSHEPKKRS